MAGFHARDFNYDGETSFEYDVQLYFINDGNGFKEQPSGSDVEIVWDNIYRQAEKLVFGIRQDKTMEFDITIGSLRPKCRGEIDKILVWLTGRQKPAWLEIRQADLIETRFLCFITNPKVITIGNLPYAVKCHVICTSPYAYSYEDILQYEITTGSIKFEFNNISADREYLYPQLRFTPASGTQSFSLTNLTDNNRKFEFDFKPIPNGEEVIEIDNRRQIVTSSVDNNRFRDFNKMWFRLQRGTNLLAAEGNGVLEMVYMFPKRVGG